MITEDEDLIREICNAIHRNRTPDVSKSGHKKPEQDEEGTGRDFPFQKLKDNRHNSDEFNSGMEADGIN